MRVCVDTNVLVSSLLFGGNPARIVELAREGLIEMFLSPFILNELEEVLKTKFGFSDGDAKEARTDAESIAQIVTPQKQIHTIRRKDSDNRILECAVEAKVSVLVSGNFTDIIPLQHFQGIEILSPRAFLDKYFPSHS